jgi:hypothetical protein
VCPPSGIVGRWLCGSLSEDEEARGHADAVEQQGVLLDVLGKEDLRGGFNGRGRGGGIRSTILKWKAEKTGRGAPQCTR